MQQNIATSAMDEGLVKLVRSVKGTAEYRKCDDELVRLHLLKTAIPKATVTSLIAEAGLATTNYTYSRYRHMLAQGSGPNPVGRPGLLPIDLERKLAAQLRAAFDRKEPVPSNQLRHMVCFPSCYTVMPA
jgi:hypothetical protein